MLTTKNKGFPVAYYKLDNKGDNKIISYLEEEENPIKDQDYLTNIDEKMIFDNDLISKLKKRYKQKEIANVKNVLKRKGALNKISKVVVDDLVDQSKKEFSFKEKKCMFLPDLEKRNVVYIAGPSGAGKSHVCSAYAQSYNLYFPENSVFLFSKKTSDPVFDNLEFIERLEVDPEVMKDLTVDDFVNTLVIFDDTHTYNDEELEAINRLQSDLMDLGRDRKVDLVITNHLLTNYNKTRQVLNEATKYCIYPSGTNFHSLKRFLNIYCGIGANGMKKLKKLGSRWVMINRFPNYIVHEKGALIL